MVVVGCIFFSLFLDIDGQSLRLRGPFFYTVYEILVQQFLVIIVLDIFYLGLPYPFY